MFLIHFGTYPLQILDRYTRIILVTVVPSPLRVWKSHYDAWIIMEVDSMEVGADCVLCVRIVNRRQDSRWVTDLPSGSLFFSDFHMRWPGSLMLVNSRHVLEQTELEENMRWQLFRDRDWVERAILQVLQPARLNLAKFGNVCEHLHWHFIPRYAGEVFARLSPWEIIETDPQALFTQERPHWEEDKLRLALRHALGGNI